MSTKHYDSNYLEDTGRFFNSLKEFSYQPFMSLTNGHIVDLGCGTGMDVIMMAKMLGEKVKVTGIDHDSGMLEKGKEAARGMSNTEFILSEASPLVYQNNSLQGLRAERLIQHLNEPFKIMKEIHRVLKPRSPVVIVETDWSGLIFYDKHVEIARKVITYLAERKVNNGYAARNLTAYLKDADFKNIKIEIFPFVLKSLNQAFEYLWLDKVLKETTDKKIISEEEYNLFIASLKEADKSGYFGCSMNMVVVSAIK